MKLALSTDHTGFEQIKKLKQFLTDLGHDCVDFGPKVEDSADDYPDFIRPAAEAVARGEADAGIIMGGSGQGEAMAANRVRGVRCAVYYGPAKAIGSIDAEGQAASDDFENLRLTRKHNNANVLSVAARFVSQEDIEKAVSIWLETPFSHADRHERRIAKLDQPGA